MGMFEPNVSYDNQIAVSRALKKDTGTKVYFDDDAMVRESDNKTLTTDAFNKSYGQLRRIIEDAEPSSNDGSELTRTQNKLDKIAKKMRNNPPADYDAIWNSLNEQLTDDEAREINKMAAEDQGTHRKGDDYPDDVMWEAVEWFIERYDVVTQEELDDAHGADDGLSDAMFIVDIDEGDIEYEDMKIEVEDTHEACQAAINALNLAETYLGELCQELSASRKNPTMLAVGENIAIARGYLYGLDHCPDDPDRDSAEEQQWRDDSRA